MAESGNVGGLDEVQRNLQAAMTEIHRKAERASGIIAALLEGYAKSHHPWKPDTGNTDTSTTGTWEHVEEDIYRVVLSAGMDYDKFLEFARQGRLAWLWPAIEENADLIREIWAKELSL